MAMYGLRKISRLLFVISLVLTANVLRAAADESDAATSFMASRLVRSNCSAGYDTESSNCSCETSDYCCDSGIFGRGWLIPDLSDSGRKSLADKHAPAGLMGDHVHDRGEWMFEYKYMNMYMEDNRIGTSTVSDAAAFGFGRHKRVGDANTNDDGNAHDAHHVRVDRQRHAVRHADVEFADHGSSSQHAISAQRTIGRHAVYDPQFWFRRPNAWRDVAIP